MPSERLQRRLERLLDQAEEAADHRAWPVVAESVRMALSLDPDNPDALALRRMVQAADAAAAAAPRSSADSVVPAPEASALPRSFVDGRYEIKEFLGEGGCKQVYLAHDTNLDRDVAFARIKTEGLDADGGQRVVRGAQAIRELATQLAANPGFEFDVQLDTVEVASSGDLAYLVGFYQLTLNDASGNPVIDYGKFVEVWKKHPDNTWNHELAIWNSDDP